MEWNGMVCRSSPELGLARGERVPVAKGFVFQLLLVSSSARPQVETLKAAVMDASLFKASWHRGSTYVPPRSILVGYGSRSF